MPLGEALRAGATCGGSPAALLARIATSVERGRSLSEVLRATTGALGDDEVAVIRAGERGGTVRESVGILVDQLESSDQERRRITAALTYPCLLVVTMMAVMTLMSTVVLPPLADLYASGGANLPPATRALLKAGTFTSAYGPRTLLTLACVVLLVACAYRTSASARHALDRLAVSIPAIGTIVAASYKQRVYGVLSALLASGCDVAEALSLSASAVGNLYVRACIARMRRLVLRGATLSEALARAGLDASGSDVGLLRQAEAIGDYPSAFAQMAAVCAQRRSEAVDRLVATAEPAAVILMAVAVGMSALALYQPILNSAAVLGGL